MATATLDWIGPSAEVGDSSSISAKYWVDGAADYNAAIAATLAAAPRRLGNLVLTDTKADPETDTLWYSSVTYGTKTLQESTYSFEIGVSSTKITQSLQTIDRFARPGKTASNCFGAIGVTKDGVEGTEINVPTFTFSETHYLPKSQMTKAFFVVLFNTTAQMNAASFRDFDRGEVLLIGVNGSVSSAVPAWEMQFKFICLPNATNLMVNDISITRKLGHDYLWVRYLEQKDSASNSMIKIPYEVFVERVYQFGDYDALRLPDPF